MILEKLKDALITFAGDAAELLIERLLHTDKSPDDRLAKLEAEMAVVKNAISPGAIDTAVSAVVTDLIKHDK